MLTGELVRALGWALIHFVWQGAVIAGLAAAVLRLLQGGSAQVRYAVACCALAAMLAMPVLTGIAVHTSTGAAVSGSGSAAVGAVAGTLAELLGPAPAAAGEPSRRVGGEQVLLWVVYAWVAGVLLLTLRTLAGWTALRRLRRSAAPASAMWRRRVAELGQQLGVGVRVELLQSPGAGVPMVIGVLRPIILMPAAALTGLTPQQVEAVLLHELAHVRRYDHVVNLVQIAVETLLFYNPAVWWLSNRVREEREHCCDDMAAAGVGGALPYAQSLLQLEELRRAPSLALAATGGSLLHRVRRLLAPPPPPRAGAYSVVVVLLVVFLGTTAAVHAYAPAASAEPRATVDGPVATSPATYILVGAGEFGVARPERLAAVLGGYGVTAVYSASDRSTLQAAAPLADMLGVARIPYDFGADPDRFARHLISGSFLASFGRIAVVVLSPAQIHSFVTHATAGQVGDTRLGAGEVFVVEIPGSVARVRVE